MQIEILTPEKKVFEGDVYSVRLPGVDGSFELLNHHAALVAALENGIITIQTEKGTTQNFHVTGGFVECLHNKVAVLIEGLAE